MELGDPVSYVWAESVSLVSTQLAQGKLRAVDRARRFTMSLSQTPPNPQRPMALVGYGYRLPAGLKTDDDFWELLCSREVARVDVTKERYDNGQVPWDGQPNPFKYACQWQGVFTGMGTSAP
eukprot:1190561-Prorocentrum_minimum.AAC.5